MEKQAAFDRQLRGIRRMRAAVSAEVLAPFDKPLADLERNESEFIRKYSGLKAPRLRDWRDMDRDLDGMNAAVAKVYWDLKFHVLLND